MGRVVRLAAAAAIASVTDQTDDGAGLTEPLVVWSGKSADAGGRPRRGRPAM